MRRDLTTPFVGYPRGALKIGLAPGANGDCWGRICAVSGGVIQAESISPRKARCRRIRLRAEVDSDDVVLTRNHIPINDTQHGNTRFFLLSYCALRFDRNGRGASPGGIEHAPVAITVSLS